MELLPSFLTYHMKLALIEECLLVLPLKALLASGVQVVYNNVLGFLASSYWLTIAILVVDLRHKFDQFSYCVADKHGIILIRKLGKLSCKKHKLLREK